VSSASIFDETEVLSEYIVVIIKPFYFFQTGLSEKQLPKGTS